MEQNTCAGCVMGMVRDEDGFHIDPRPEGIRVDVEKMYMSGLQFGYPMIPCANFTPEQQTT